jgi:prevent-host-death family protein
MIQITATDAKNRFGQMLDACQTEPVFIAKSGRRHGVLLSMQQYQMLSQRQDSGGLEVLKSSAQPASPAEQFRAQNQSWVEEIHSLVAQHGVWSDGLMEAPNGAV